MDSNDSLPENNSIFNISSHLREAAARHPHRRAVVVPETRDRAGRIAYTHLTFSELENESDAMAFGLTSIGITRGTRTILMVTPGIEFFILTFSLFKIGAIPVVVDPGMGIQRMLECLKQSEPVAFVGIPKAHLLRMVFPKYFQTVRIRVTVGRRWFWGGHSFRRIRHHGNDPFPIAQTRYKEAAAILFTTGSTGPAKGAIYTHKTFDAQIRQIKSYFNPGEDEIDLPTFPLFALFDPALGMTAVIPDMNPTRPAFVNPRKIIEIIENQGITNMFASPALLNRVGRFGKENGIRLPSLRRVVSAGAPVTPANIEQFLTMLADDAQIHTPYGATEAVPVAAIGSREILSETAMRTEKGHGICVGLPLDGVEVNIIRIDDGPIKQWSDSLLVEDGDIGEIVVRGNLVSPRYFKRPRQNALSKIIKGKTVYHRMGDLGWRDNKGRIWFCGRKSHRVITENGPLFTIPCESIFNTHPGVSRSALVGVGNPPEQKPVICIELNKKQKGTSRKELEQELLQLAKSNFLTENINTFLFHRRFPVDIRHNSKIFREKLALWAEKKIKGHGVMGP